MTKETILKLLRSSDTEDQILGVNFANSYLGREWCKQNFRGENGRGNFPTNGKTFLVFENYTVILGNWYIDYYGYEVLETVLLDFKMINCKINDTNKELSESTK